MTGLDYAVSFYAGVYRLEEGDKDIDKMLEKLKDPENSDDDQQDNEESSEQENEDCANDDNKSSSKEKRQQE